MKKDTRLIKRRSRLQRVSLGERVQGLREGADLSQKDLARLIGVSRSTISRLERGLIGDPRVSLIGRLARVFAVRMEFIVGYEAIGGRSCRRTSRRA